ncbi:MAG: hypothetical protein ACLQU4_17750 [Limisphaerales bacterium]
MALIVGSLPCMAPGAANDAAAVAAQYHCAGCAQLTGNTNLSTLQKALALPSADPVWKLARQRFSKALAGGLNLETNPSTASLIEPLLSDILQRESLGVFSCSMNSPGFVLALRLDAKRAQVWQANLGQAFGGPGEKWTAEEFNGWRWKIGTSDSFWIMPARDWLLVGRGDALLPVQAEYLRQVSREGRPEPALADKWLEADVDCARLAGWLPDWMRLLKPARIKLIATSERDNLHITARMIYPEAILWEPRSWQMPTELAQGPIISFTAGQNIGAFLNLSPAFSQLDGDPLTNQFCAWALHGLPLLTYMSWPVADVTNTLQEVSTEAMTALNPELKKFNGTELVWQEDRRKLVLSNLRVILPSLEAVHNQEGDFLLLSVFPFSSPTGPATNELWKQIKGRTNLVYYDWELTGARLQDWRLLGRMLLTRTRTPTPGVLRARMVEDKWLGDLGFFEGKTITEITRPAPNELSVVRNAPVGLTGIEIFLLSDWLSTFGSPPVESRLPAP